jgi:hypothetical protein
LNSARREQYRLPLFLKLYIPYLFYNCLII